MVLFRRVDELAWVLCLIGSSISSSSLGSSSSSSSGEARARLGPSPG